MPVDHPGSSPGQALCLGQAVGRPRHGVVVSIADAAERRFDACSGLTTMSQPVVTMIGRGLDLLQARMRDKGLPDETISLRGRLIERGSSGPKGR